MLKIAAKANDQGILDKVFQHQNHQGQTAVDILMSKGNVASIQKLLSSEIGKEILMMHVNQHGSKVLSEIKNGNGNSLVHLAAEAKDLALLTVLHKLGADFTIPNDKKQTALSIWPEGCESAKPLAVAKAANVSTPPTTNGNEIKAVSELSDINLKDAINAENLKAIQQWGAENKTRFLGQIEGFSPITYALQGDKPKLGCAIAMLAALEAKDIVNDQVQLNSIRAFINSNNDACRQILTLVENDPAMIKGVLKRESALGQVLNPIIATSISFFGKGDNVTQTLKAIEKLAPPPRGSITGKMSDSYTQAQSKAAIKEQQHAAPTTPSPVECVYRSSEMGTISYLTKQEYDRNDLHYPSKRQNDSQYFCGAINHDVNNCSFH